MIPAMPAIDQRIKATHHVALCTPNFEGIERFYTQTLGLRVLRRWGHRRTTLIDSDSVAIELAGGDDATGGNRSNGV